MGQALFSAGIVAAEAWLLGALWRMTRVIRPKKRTKASAGSKICLVWRNYIQTVSFGLLFYALCQYVNADRNYYHYTNTRWMLIFLAAAFLMNYNQRLFLNWISAAWFGLSVVGSVLYCNGFRADEKELVLARLTCGVVIAWGLLVICIIHSVVRAEKVRFWDFIQRFHEDIPYMMHLALWVLFALLMFMYRFEKVWVITATLPFAAYFFEGDAAGKGEVPPQFLQRHPAQLCAGDGILSAPQAAPLLDALPVWRHVPHRGVRGCTSRWYLGRQSQSCTANSKRARAW